MDKNRFGNEGKLRVPHSLQNSPPQWPWGRSSGENLGRSHDAASKFWSVVHESNGRDLYDEPQPENQRVRTACLEDVPFVLALRARERARARASDAPKSELGIDSIARWRLDEDYLREHERVLAAYARIRRRIEAQRELEEAAWEFELPLRAIDRATCRGSQHSSSARRRDSRRATRRTLPKLRSSSNDGGDGPEPPSHQLDPSWVESYRQTTASRSIGVVS